MSVKTTIPISEARQQIFNIVKQVQRPGRQFIVTESGRPKMVILSADEFESWQETLEVLREFPGLDRDMAQTKRDLRTGAYRKYPTLEDLKKDWGYGIHAVSKTKRQKRA